MTKVPDGWRYQDGSVWSTLNALRDHLLSVSRAELAATPEAVAALASRRPA